MIATATNKYTGEVTEIDIRNLSGLMYAYNVAAEMEKNAKAIKNQCKEELDTYLDASGKSAELDGRQFKRTFVQRMTYDKSVLREHLDPDAFDVLTIIDKTAADKYFKENLDSLGEISTIARRSMIPVGVGYTMTKLEKTIR